MFVISHRHPGNCSQCGPTRRHKVNSESELAAGREEGRGDLPRRPRGTLLPPRSASETWDSGAGLADSAYRDVFMTFSAHWNVFMIWPVIHDVIVDVF